MKFLMVVVLILWTSLAFANCSKESFKTVNIIVCQVDSKLHEPLLVHKNSDGKPYKSVKQVVSQNSDDIVFLMNAGMYHDDLSPVGLYVEEGKELYPLNTNDGPGNFHMKPNGIFLVEQTSQGHYNYSVIDTDSYKENKFKPYFATQSGPMLVINNVIHPRFIPDSDSRFIRNGVGVDDLGNVFFAITQQPINFYDFALFFRDRLKTPNALYFDGKISSLYAPPFPTQITWYSVGPIVGAKMKKISK